MTNNYDRWFGWLLAVGALAWIFYMPGGAGIVALVLVAVVALDRRRA